MLSILAICCAPWTWPQPKLNARREDKPRKLVSSWYQQIYFESIFFLINNSNTKGVKTVSVEEFLAVYAEFYKMPEKTWGTFEDFMEGLKLYDKDQNGLLSLAELSQVLVMMGKCRFYIFQKFYV